MKALVLALCVALAACDAPPENASTASPDAAIAPFVPGAGPAQEISSALVLDSSLRVKLRFSYDLDWDATLAWGVTPNAGGRQVFPVNQMLCPNIWVLVCHDYGCSQVEGQFASVPPAVYTMQRQDHFPAPLEYKYCDYDVRANGAATGTTGIPVARGTNYVWAGFRCPSGQYSWNGSTGVSYLQVSYYGTDMGTVDMGTFQGPFGDKLGWAERARGCVGMDLGDPAWYSTTPLEIKWCLSNYGSNTCVPGTQMSRQANW